MQRPREIRAKKTEFYKYFLKIAASKMKSVISYHNIHVIIDRKRFDHCKNEAYLRAENNTWQSTVAEK